MTATVALTVFSKAVTQFKWERRNQLRTQCLDPWRFNPVVNDKQLKAISENFGAWTRFKVYCESQGIELTFEEQECFAESQRQFQTVEQERMNALVRSDINRYHQQQQNQQAEEAKGEING